MSQPEPTPDASSSSSFLFSDQHHQMLAQQNQFALVQSLSLEESINKKPIRSNGLCTKYRKMIPNLKMKKSRQTCTICIEGFETDQTIKQLPCKHIMHRECAKQWLKVNKICPICRLDLFNHFQTAEREQLEKANESKTGQNVLS